MECFGSVSCCRAVFQKVRHSPFETEKPNRNLIRFSLLFFDFSVVKKRIFILYGASTIQQMKKENWITFASAVNPHGNLNTFQPTHIQTFLAIFGSFSLIGNVPLVSFCRLFVHFKTEKVASFNCSVWVRTVLFSCAPASLRVCRFQYLACKLLLSTGLNWNN